MKTSTLSALSPLSIALVALSSAAISLAGCALSTDDEEAVDNYDDAVGEAEQATTVNFPGNLTASIGPSNVSSYEPSGLARRNGILYMASDDGKIARYDSSSATWKTEITSTNSNFSDFESLTVATNNQLLVGVEGKNTSNPAQIAKVNLSSKSFGQSWRLNGVTNMEAMTFVPDTYSPLGPANTTAHPGDFSGYFFVATQQNPGHIAVYRLDRDDSDGTLVDNYDIDIDLQTSDMCFANGVLYVLFDDHNATDLIAVYVINTNPNQNPHILAYQKQYGLPTINGTSFNYEGITFDYQTIYLGRDHNGSPSDNGVYQFADTLIYPLTVLPPLSW